jgi:hypothetical protein
MKKSLLFLCLVVMFVSPVLAQSNYAVVGGVITDPQHRALPGVTVQITSLSTQAVRKIASDDRGIFQVTGLLPGEYELTVLATGFASVKERLLLEVGQQLNLEVNLKLASLVNTVDVAAQLDVLRTDASVGEVIEPIAIRELPLNGRMLVDLMLTVPGAHEGHGAQTGDMNPLYWRPGQRSAVSIGGNRPNANYFLLDGGTNTDPTFNTLNLSPSPDAVREFKVLTGNYSAEMGGAGGGQVNIVTRSGTNAFHGTAYNFLRNDALDARSFNEMSESSHLVQNNFGGSLGGPIVRDKTFFFVNYEGLRHTRSMTMIQTVPTDMEIMGDFSMSGATIYNPFSSHPNPNFDSTKPVSPTNPQILRDPFPGNVIPGNLISPVAATFLQKYTPRPSMDMEMGTTMNGCGMTMMGAPTVIGGGVDCNNYMDVRNERHVTDQATFRVDHSFSRGDTLAVRYSLSGENGFTPQNLPGFGAIHDNFSQHGNISWTRIVNSRMVNIGTITISRLSMHRSSENSESNDIVSELGIQGVGFGGKGAYGAPWFNVQGYSGMGDTFAATPMHAWGTILEARDSLSWQQGSHNLKVGGSFRRYIWPMWGFFQNRGYYQFTNGFTTATATNDGTGSALASFLLGLPAVKQRQAGIPQMQLRQWYADGFVQDSFRLASNTTVEAGLRYEYMSPLHDIRYTNTNLIFQDGKPYAFIGGQNGYPEGLLYSRRTNFAPRLGLTQNLPQYGIAIRTGYGIFYTPVDMNSWCNQRHNVPYVFPETRQSDNFIPSLFGFDFGAPVLGQTTVSFASFDPHAPSQYIQQWNLTVEKSLGKDSTIEVGYLGTRGLHLQRSHLVNNAQPGAGPIQPRRPFPTISFVPNTVLPDNVTVTNTTFPVSAINLLENTARSWYDAGYVNLRKRYSSGLSVLANYTFAKSLSDAPDFRSPMFESAIPQNNNNLFAEKGPGCDIRHRFSLSAVYNLPNLKVSNLVQALTENWRLSTVFQAQSGFPFTVSVFGDTANAGTLLGENPIRANTTGAPVFGPGTKTADRWMNPAAFAVPAAFTFGNVGRNSVYGPGLQTLDLALARQFNATETVNLQLRAEFFNALNHTNLGTPGRFVNTPQFGTITEAATPGREVQLSMRVSF